MKNTRTEHRCNPEKPICTRCEINAAGEIEHNRAYARKIFAAAGHNYDDPNDDGNFL